MVRHRVDQQAKEIEAEARQKYRDAEAAAACCQQGAANGAFMVGPGPDGLTCKPD